MMDSLINTLLDQIKREEGSISHMYLDTRGYVTVGVGYLLADESAACALPFVHRLTGLAASAEDIAKEFHYLKSQTPGLKASAYFSATTLELPQAVIDQQLAQNLSHFTHSLQEKIDGFSSFPTPARIALIDMAFNLGINGLLNKFPKLIDYVAAGDWQHCAAECKRGGIGDSRNAATRQLFLDAATESIG